MLVGYGSLWDLFCFIHSVCTERAYRRFTYFYISSSSFIIDLSRVLLLTLEIVWRIWDLLNATCFTRAQSCAAVAKI